jgi:hypothetical protein
MFWFVILVVAGTYYVVQWGKKKAAEQGQAQAQAQEQLQGQPQVREMLGRPAQMPVQSAPAHLSTPPPVVPLDLIRGNVTTQLTPERETAQVNENVRRVLSALSDPTPVAPPRTDETTDYGKMLAFISSLGPQLDTTPTVVHLGAKTIIHPRLKLTDRFAFIFSGQGKLEMYFDLRGESESLLADVSRATRKDDYRTMADIISPYILSGLSRVEVKADPNAPGGPRITFHGHVTFQFAPDGGLRSFFNEASEKRVDAMMPPMPPARPGATAAQIAQPQQQQMPMPASPQPQLRPQQAAFPGRTVADGNQAASSTPATPWQERRGQ